MSDTIEVHFIHPRNSAMTLVADLSPDCTGQEAVQGLLCDSDGSGAFLLPLPAGQTYGLSLRRTQTPVTPNMTFANAGVIDGDVIDVEMFMTGAGPAWAELGQIVFWSATAAAIFLKSAGPIFVEYLRGKSSRSIKIRFGEDRKIEQFEITGASPEEAMDIVDMVNARNREAELGGAAPDRMPLPIVILLRDSRGSTED